MFLHCHSFCVSFSLDYLKLKLESKCRLPIPEFSGYHCMKLMFDTLKIYANAIFTYKAFVSKKSISSLFPIHFLSISCLFIHISHWYTMFHGGLLSHFICSQFRIPGCAPPLCLCSTVFGTFPKAFSQVTNFQVATSQMCNFRSGNFLKVRLGPMRRRRLQWERGRALWLEQEVAIGKNLLEKRLFVFCWNYGWQLGELQENARKS